MKKRKNFIIQYIQIKLAHMNSSNINTKKGIRIFTELIIVEIVYLSYCFYFFYGIWYLNIFILVSCLVFGYSYLDVRLELLQNKFKNDVPKTIRKLRYYLIHTKNISKALEKTYEKAPESTKKYIDEINVAINSIDPKTEIEELKKHMPLEWLKMICNLAYYCKINGDKEQSTSKNLSRVTNIIEFQNLRQGLDNVELLGSQIFVFVLPILGIPGIQLINNSFLVALEQNNVYATQLSSIESAKILLAANIFTLFLSWTRKNN